MILYRATRSFPAARTDEDAALAYWSSVPTATRQEAVTALVEHMTQEARSLLRVAASSASERAGEMALELSRLAGVVDTWGADTLPEVVAANGVVYQVKAFEGQPRKR